MKSLTQIVAETCAFFLKHDENMLETICWNDDRNDAGDQYERSILIVMIHQEQPIHIKSIEDFTSVITKRIKQDVRHVKILDIILKHFDIVVSLTSLDLLCVLRSLIETRKEQEDVLQALFNVYLKRVVNIPLNSRLATRLACFYSKYNVEKLEEVMMLSKKYANQEDKLFGKLIKKYGPERARFDMCDALHDVIVSSVRLENLPHIVSILCRVVDDNDHTWYERMENLATLLYDIGTRDSALVLESCVRKNLVSRQFRENLRDKCLNDLKLMSLRSLDCKRNDTDADCT